MLWSQVQAVLTLHAVDISQLAAPTSDVPLRGCWCNQTGQKWAYFLQNFMGSSFAAQAKCFKTDWFDKRTTFASQFRVFFSVHHIFYLWKHQVRTSYPQEKYLIKHKGPSVCSSIFAYPDIRSADLLQTWQARFWDRRQGSVDCKYVQMSLILGVLCHSES